MHTHTIPALLFSVLALYSNYCSAFVSYALLTRGSQKILLLGDLHDERHAVINASHVNYLINTIFRDPLVIANNKNPITCFIELDKAKLANPKFLLTVTFEMLKKYSFEKNSLLNFNYCESRDREADIFQTVLRIFLSGFTKNAKHCDFIPALKALEKEAALRNYTLSAYFLTLDKYIGLLRDWFGDHHESTQKFLAYKKEATQFFKSSSSNTELIQAISTVFQTYTDPVVFGNKYWQLRKFVDYTNSWLDYSILYHAKTYFEQQSRPLLCILGDGHVQALEQLFKQEGFTVLFSERLIQRPDPMSYTISLDRFKQFAPTIRAVKKFF